MPCSVFWQGAGHKDPPGWLFLPRERHKPITCGWSLARCLSAAELPAGVTAPGRDLPSPQLPPCWTPVLQQLLQGHFSAGWLPRDGANSPTPPVTSLPPLPAPNCPAEGRGAALGSASPWHRSLHSNPREGSSPHPTQRIRPNPR